MTMKLQNLPCCSYYPRGYEPNAIALTESYSLMQTRSKSSSSAKSTNSVFTIDSDTSSLDCYKPPPTKRICSKPLNQTRRPTPYHFDSIRSFSAGLRTRNSSSASCSSYPQDSPTEVIQHQRRLIRSSHFARNQWVKPSLHRLTLIQEYISDLKAFEEAKHPESLSPRTIELRNEEKVRIIHKLEDLIAVQLEEVKGTELTQYNELVQEELFGNYQLLPTICFDCEGKQINHTDLLEVEDPYSGGTQQGRIIQVLNNNIVLVRLASTGRVVTKFGFEVKLLTEI